MAKERLSAERRLLEEVHGHSGAWAAAQVAEILADVPPRPATRRRLSLEEMGAYWEPIDAESLPVSRRRR